MLSSAAGDWKNLDELKSRIVDLAENNHDVCLCAASVAQEIAAAIRNHDEDGDHAIVGNDIADPFKAGVVLIPKGAQIVV